MWHVYYYLLVVARRSTSLCNNRICTPSLTAKLYLFCNRGHQCSPLAPFPQAHTICCTDTNNFISIRLWNFCKCLPACLEYRISVSVRVVFMQKANCEIFLHHKRIYAFWILLYFTPQLNPSLLFWANVDRYRMCSAFWRTVIT
jgi:hypothetical protein